MNNFLGRTIEGSYMIGSNNIKQQNIPYNQCTLLIMGWVFVGFFFLGGGGVKVRKHMKT